MSKQDDVVNLDVERSLREMEQNGTFDMIRAWWDANLERILKERGDVVNIQDYKISRLPLAPLYDMFLYQAWSRKSQLEEELDLAGYNDVVHGQRDATINSRVRLVLADFFVNGYSAKKFKGVEVYNGHLVPLLMIAEETIAHTSANIMNPSYNLIMANVSKQKYLGNVKTTII